MSHNPQHLTLNQRVGGSKPSRRTGQRCNATKNCTQSYTQPLKTGSLKFAIAALALTATAALAAPLAQADTVITVNGSAFSPPPAPDLATLYGGLFIADTEENVAYPASLWPLTPTEQTLGQSVKIGIGLLNTDLSSTSVPTTVVGWSQGSMVIDAEQAALLSQPTIPGLSFIVAGDPARPGGILSYLPAGTYVPILNYTTQPVPQSQYDTTVLTIAYDGIADFPDRPWNVVADLNAVMGAAYYHPDEGQYLPTTGGVTTVNANGGTTTTYLEPAPYLPLTEPLTQIGVPAPMVNALDSVLTPIVNAGYSRYDSPSALVTAPYLKVGGGIVPPSINVAAVQSVLPKLPTATPSAPSALAAVQSAARKLRTSTHSVHQAVQSSRTNAPGRHRAAKSK